MKQLFGTFDLSTREYTDKSEAVYSFETQDINVYIFGNIEYNDKTNCGNELCALFSEKRLDFTKCVSGCYIAVFYDKFKKQLTVFHDITTSPVTLYYTENQGKVYLGTSLKSILALSEISRELDPSAVEEFLLNGFIFGKKTLIKNVFKINAFHALTISEAVFQTGIEYATASLTAEEALCEFKPELDKAINKCFHEETEISLALSGGYDSNYIAYIADSQTGLPIKAFSVGGKSGKNELPIVEENVKYYDRIKLYTALTDTGSLNDLPDIVWRLEGAVYESGLFLQYELMKLVIESGESNLVCGECADQVMNIDYLNPARISPSLEEKHIHFDFAEYPFIIGNYLILKKSGILANSFGIDTRYPYLDAKLQPIFSALKYINGKDKRCHTANCCENIPDSIVKNIAKVGGATECCSLFNDKKEIRAFLKGIEKSSFYKSYSASIKKCSLQELNKEIGVQRIKTILHNTAINILNKNAKNKRRNTALEMQLRESLCIAYLIIFDELFISGKYDNEFEKKQLDRTIKDFI